jgi:hypothetical protein
MQASGRGCSVVTLESSVSTPAFPQATPFPVTLASNVGWAENQGRS